MEHTLETVALFALKLVYETQGSSPVLRDDLVMDEYQQEVFGLLVRQGDVDAITLKVDRCVALALDALGGAGTVMGRELHRLAAQCSQARTLDELNAPLLALRDYLKDIQ